MNPTKGLAGLGQFLFWVCIIASQMIGLTIGRFQVAQMFALFCHAHPFLAPLLFQILTAIACFLIFYMVAVNVIVTVEQRAGIQIRKPGVKQGILYAAAIPLILCIIGFILVKFLSHSSIYG
jgi:hypothetical protein